MNRLEKRFRALKKNKKKAFIAFLTAGYPTLGATEKLIREIDAAGADIIELGVPFSDPLADGAVIQEASQKSLEKKTHLEDIMRLVKKVRSSTDIPLCLMTYYNPVFCFGEERFVRTACASGVDGVIVPDLPPEEAGLLMKTARKYGLDVVCFVSPTTSVRRMKYIAKISTGFIYYVSITGVTGARRKLAADLLKNIRQLKRITSKPVCVGFGVSTPSQVKQVQSVADGVIVGSAIVKKIKEDIHSPALARKLGAFIRQLKG